jgi:REP element-mobilizing transposase RayT
LIDEMEAARREFPIDLWAYVIMPEHVHLLIYPREQVEVGILEGRIKEKVARKAIRFLEENAPPARQAPLLAAWRGIRSQRDRAIHAPRDD